MGELKEYGLDVEPVLALARRAGDAILEVYGTDDFGVEIKQDASPLTLAV